MFATAPETKPYRRKMEEGVDYLQHYKIYGEKPKDTDNAVHDEYEGNKSEPNLCL